MIEGYAVRSVSFVVLFVNGGGSCSIQRGEGEQAKAKSLGGAYPAGKGLTELRAVRYFQDRPERDGMMNAAGSRFEEVFAPTRDGVHRLDVHRETAGAGLTVQPGQQIFATDEGDALGVLGPVNAPVGPDNAEL